MSGARPRLERSRRVLWTGVLALALGGCAKEAAPGPSGSPDLAIDCVVEPHACGLCVSDGDCPVEAPRCELGTHSCAPCLPENDNCPADLVCHLGDGLYSCRKCTTHDECKGRGGVCCDGACVSLTSDPKSCGACGNVCRPVTPHCEPAQMPCEQGRCAREWPDLPGFCDCDGNPDDGPETPVDRDPLNCGACGHRCIPFAAGIPTCTNGVCGSVCAPGFADCNRDLSDGCEIEIAGDVVNCGACGHVCVSPPGAIAACDASKCGFRCALDRGDCNGFPDDGCELDLTADAMNCGHCGNVCPGLMPACVKSVCQR